jgi:N-acetylglucosaminyldiphosphoundecaprenol N-acetyl-beta-D-mannosaminyltransferase
MAMYAIKAEQTYMDGRCVIIGRQQEVFWLESILEHHFSEIFVVQSTTDIVNLSQSSLMLLVLATDTCPDKLHLSLLRFIKAKMKPLLTICLMDDITPRVEVQLRSTGLSFLGSYSTFLKHVESILVDATLRLATKKKMKSFHVRPFGMVIP